MELKSASNHNIPAFLVPELSVFFDRSTFPEVQKIPTCGGHCV